MDEKVITRLVREPAGAPSLHASSQGERAGGPRCHGDAYPGPHGEAPNPGKDFRRLRRSKDLESWVERSPLVEVALDPR